MLIKKIFPHFLLLFSNSFSAQGKYAFNMGNRSQLQSINTWPQPHTDWLLDNGYLQ